MDSATKRAGEARERERERERAGGWLGGGKLERNFPPVDPRGQRNFPPVISKINLESRHGTRELTNFCRCLRRVVRCRTSFPGDRFVRSSVVVSSRILRFRDYSLIAAEFWMILGRKL